MLLAFFYQPPPREPMPRPAPRRMPGPAPLPTRTRARWWQSTPTVRDDGGLACPGRGWSHRGACLPRSSPRTLAPRGFFSPSPPLPSSRHPQSAQTHQPQTFSLSQTRDYGFHHLHPAVSARRGGAGMAERKGAERRMRCLGQGKRARARAQGGQGAPRPPQRASRPRSRHAPSPQGVQAGV